MAFYLGDVTLTPHQLHGALNKRCMKLCGCNKLNWEKYEDVYYIYRADTDESNIRFWLDEYDEDGNIVMFDMKPPTIVHKNAKEWPDETLGYILDQEHLLSIGLVAHRDYDLLPDA